MFKLLLEKGVPFQSLEYQGETALDYACLSPEVGDRDNLAVELVRLQAPCGPKAAEHIFRAFLTWRSLLKVPKQYVLSPFPSGNYPLHLAVSHGQREDVELLRRAGYRLYVFDSKNRLPSTLAEEAGKGELASYLRPLEEVDSYLA